MNIRISNAFDTDRVRKMPSAIRNADSRTRLIASIAAVLFLVFVIYV